MVIRQGDVFWLALAAPYGSEPGYRRPVVVVQGNRFNQSNIQTIVTCALTSNLKLATSVGNVRLAKGEANLPKRSVVNVSQIMTFDRTRFVEKIGTLSAERLKEILGGIYLMLNPLDVD